MRSDVGDFASRRRLLAERKGTAEVLCGASTRVVSRWTRGYIMTDDDKIRRWTIMRLMCDLGLDYAAMGKSLGIDFKELFCERTRFVRRYASRRARSR